MVSKPLKSHEVPLLLGGLELVYQVICRLFPVEITGGFCGLRRQSFVGHIGLGSGGSGFYRDEPDNDFARVRIEITGIGVLSDFTAAVAIAEGNLGIAFIARKKSEASQFIRKRGARQVGQTLFNAGLDVSYFIFNYINNTFAQSFVRR